MTGRSNALRWPVQAPRGRVHLTGLQWQLWWLLSRPRRTWMHGDVTLARLSTLTGSSRGRCWHAMSRLRSLELVSWRAYPVMELVPDRRPRRWSPGRRGRLLVWIPAPARRARLTAAAGLRGHTGNDSVSGPFGAYIAREGLTAALRRRLGSRRLAELSTYGGTARRPWRGPPRVLYARCPAGHRLRIGRRSWGLGPDWAPSVTARFEGPCRRCGSTVVEEIRVELAPPLPRGLSAGELADPALLAARIDSARRLAAGELHPAVRERLRRDYLERPPGYVGRWPGPLIERAGDVAAALEVARLGRVSGDGRRGDPTTSPDNTPEE